MSALTVSLLGIATTACALGVLAWRDPSRLQSRARGRPAGEGLRGWRRGQRRLLTAASLAPGAAFVAFGEWASFAVWLGALSVSGWLLARVLSQNWTTRASSLR
jgi:hypothetical protein